MSLLSSGEIMTLQQANHRDPDCLAWIDTLLFFTNRAQVLFGATQVL